jgi:hypothetical protein
VGPRVVLDSVPRFLVVPNRTLVAVLTELSELMRKLSNNLCALSGIRTGYLSNASEVR